MLTKNLKFVWLLLACFTVIGVACNREDETPVFTVEGRWELSRYDSPDHDPDEGDLIPQEAYVFNPDGTFVKTRILEDQVSEATGTYTRTAPEPPSETVRYNLELTFVTGQGLVGDCTPGTESLVVTQNLEMHNTWPACGGANITYVKVN
jgi:hypothetical protein